MGNFIRVFLRDRCGAVAIEFAAIALPLMLLLGGSIEISRYTWTRIALQDAASVGARCLGLRLESCFTSETMDRDETVNIVREQARRWGIEVPDDAVTPEETAACRDVDNFARIGVRHHFSSVLLVLPETWIDVEACFPVLPLE